MVPAIREPALTIWLFRMAVAGSIAVSFTLSACGRKGPLDAPPRAQAQQVSQQATPPQQAEVPDEYGNPPEPKGQRKGFLLDWLLN